MRKTALILLLAVMMTGPALAQECIPEDWCGAPWPPPEGRDRTAGTDSCGNTCYKIAVEVPGIPEEPEPPAIPEGTAEIEVLLYMQHRVPETLQNYFSFTRPFFYERVVVTADEVKSVPGYFVFYLNGEEQGRYNRDYVIGWNKLKKETEQISEGNK